MKGYIVAITHKDSDIFNIVYLVNTEKQALIMKKKLGKPFYIYKLKQEDDNVYCSNVGEET